MVRNRYNNLIKGRVVLDTGSTVNLITDEFARCLDLPMKPLSLSIIGINTDYVTTSKIMKVTIYSAHNAYQKTFTFITIPKITVTPSEPVPRNLIEIPKNIKLADPSFYTPAPVDLLLGAGASLSLFSVGQINISKGDDDLILQKTRLGWILVGNTPQLINPNRVTCNLINTDDQSIDVNQDTRELVNLDDRINKFWEIEEVNLERVKSREDIECEKHYIQNVSRDSSGRYTVRLAFKPSSVDPGEILGNSYTTALRRLQSLERKFESDNQLQIEYDKIIQEYLELGHMSLCVNPRENGYYMPHHAVYKETSATTKVRVVFDASAKTTNRTSLNELLYVGPTIQDKLFIQLIKFRLHRYVLTADIEKMYRQIWLHKNDRKYQRILWRVNGQVKVFEMNTVTFGVSSSPYLAIRTIHQLARDEQTTFPIAARALLNDLYVDDLLSGASTLDDAETLRDQIIALLSRGGFHIRQWASNNEKILKNVSDKNINSHFLLDKTCTLKTLGISWKPQEDSFNYQVKPIVMKETPTKRNVLSEIAKIFDPLGLLAPIIFHAKILMQKLWQHKLDWDESLPNGLHTGWSEFVSQLAHLKNVEFPRRLVVNEPTEIQIHGFCDASKSGYGACLYLRSTTRQGNTICRLICAKSKVAPLKPMTIPRLELCGALLLTRLYNEVIPSLNFQYNKIIFWSDSTIVLCWLKTEASSLNVYVANRINEIQNSTKNIEWRHVRSESNPADAVSRGQTPEAFIQNKQWSNGPTWLRLNEENWPNENLITHEIPELKKSICLITQDTNISCNTLIDWFGRFSSYEVLKRVTARIMRIMPSNAKGTQFVHELSVQEIDRAEIKILKALQAQSFARELRDLLTPPYKNKLSALCPYVDDQGVLRVGGRLTHSSLSYAQKHPIILPTRHAVTDLIIREIHERNHHSGIQTTLYNMRKKYWVLDGRNQVRWVIRKCVTCFRFDPTAVKYKMGDLPAVRVQPAIAFANTGVDFCGPFYIKEKKFRNRAQIKVYVCVFVCMVIKAVHLEVVSELTTEGFLAAFRRFTARRGCPAHVYSDNGTNFVGANNQLKEIYELFNSQKHKDTVNRYANMRKVVWHFIPPLSPHQGGLWESTVKLFKHHFKRVIGQTLFTFEAFNTFVIEIEGILNSRPLTALSSDPNDNLALSPFHYLIGQAQTELPENDLTSTPENRLSSWQHITKIRQHFWNRWIQEYLNEQIKRLKWTKDEINIQPGMVVLVKNKTIPCLQWPLGRVVQVHPGGDGVVRTATVKTASGEYQRPVSVMCPLPFAQN